MHLSERLGQFLNFGPFFLLNVAEEAHELFTHFNYIALQAYMKLLAVPHSNLKIHLDSYRIVRLLFRAYHSRSTTLIPYDCK